MQHFTRIGDADVMQLRLQLDAHPELWNQNTARTTHDGSAHTDVSDIWLRWRPPADLGDRNSYNGKFSELEWYPAINVLPAARTILMSIMARVGGTALGGSLITRIPSGGAVKPHSDAMSWHANYYRTKVYTVIQSNPNAVNWTAGESLVMEAGSVWTFDNLKEHAVYNEGAEDRITMMTAIRTD